MSLRKFMHKRNKYKEEPNFKQLAILYPEFRKVTVTDISGKVRLNFKEKESLRVLTKTLLKHDFNLEVEIPFNKLVPALPLRLNYILWIEDLLRHSGISDLSSIHGIDIGTGAICIYPLLISRMFKSKMTCTDIDPETINSAKTIIQENNLQDLINVLLVKKESILKEILLEKDSSFVMCNPPFFEKDKIVKKKIKLNPPRNAPTGNENELEVIGGEKEFITRLIQESIEYKNKVKIYTTMIGQKSSLGFLRNELIKNKIFNSTWTEFCQGYTKRWGIAWTFLSKNEIDLITAPVIRTRTEVLQSKKNKSTEIIFPAKENFNSLDEVVSIFKQWLTELKMNITELEFNEDYPCWACRLKGYDDTWTHARRKRRMAMRQQSLKKECTTNLESNEIEKLQDHQSECIKNKDIESTKPLLVCTALIGENNENSEESSSITEFNGRRTFKIVMIFESGYGGKLSLETLRQYLINKLDVRQFSCKKNINNLDTKKRKIHDE